MFYPRWTYIYLRDITFYARLANYITRIYIAIFIQRGNFVGALLVFAALSFPTLYIFVTLIVWTKNLFKKDVRLKANKNTNFDTFISNAFNKIH